MAFPLRFFQHFVSTHPDIKIIIPTDHEWADASRQYYTSQAARPDVITRPQNAAHVQDLVRLCMSNNVDFVVRTGGHDCAGRSQVNHALVIDMRDIRYIKILQDKRTAKIGGGTLIRDLATALGEEDLITPTVSGLVGSIGYVGWAILGGYGPLAAKYGLGVDQIIGARYVNAQGELVDADEEALTGLRGGGGCFGVIVELTIKVYPLKEVLMATLVFKSDDMSIAWFLFVQGYNQLLSTGSEPSCLSVQLIGKVIAGCGNMFTASVVWADDDHDEGRKWIDVIACFGNCLRKTVRATSWQILCEENEKLVGSTVYGRARTLNLRYLTPRTTQILAHYNSVIPGPESSISVQLIRDLGIGLKSVFEPRCQHYWLEIAGTSRDPQVAKHAEEWARSLKQDLIEKDPDNVLDAAYIGFLDDDEMELSKVYGDHYQTLVAVKRKLDPRNLFKNSVPRVEVGIED
ncbi:FAD-binding PCMH-type domain-containing protein [Fusarium keratoplasticum]|uniref:FAD-binding PCMH-type domain-containing protein n=1 Tax=Fusarium keratoplasticum TaxID=1328300 RepID=A0ACC0QCE9_9HYPO|nr:FAD-binding PCMH-type domain-containing protein [Fusarium keratoplasticum]KAI8649070.1 FAD-binding PCMH-type domain-containing protein [Fusarium keratoplasticum]